MSETKHTKGTLTARTVADLDFSHDLCVGQEPVACVYRVDGEANAARIVLTWNCHDDLLAALRGILAELPKYNADHHRDLADAHSAALRAIARATPREGDAG